MDPTTYYAIAGATVVVAAGAVGYWVVRRRQWQAKDERFCHFRCPGCRRRLRFQARQVGRMGGCSHCGADVTFPAVSQSID